MPRNPVQPGGPVKSKQISMLVSQQVAAKMEKYNSSAHISSTHIEGNASMDDDDHLMAMVQSAVSKHFAAPPTQPTPIRRLPPNLDPSSKWRTTVVQPKANWKEVFEQARKEHNKST